MSKYQDVYGRLHDKEVTPTDPFPCNNANLDTAYGIKAGLFLLLNSEVLTICAVDYVRHLKADVPSQVPMSRDEVLGLSYLGHTADKLTHNWRFNPKDRPIPKFSLINLIKQTAELVNVQPYYKRVLGVELKLYALSLKHRNYYWQNNLDQIYRFAFSVPLQDRYSILKWSGRFKFYRPDHLFYAGFSLIDRLGSPSGLKWLKYGGEKNMKEMIKEFKEDHPIRLKAGL